MASIISAFVATIVTIPLLGYVIVFIVSKPILKNHRRAVHLAIDVTTFLLVFSVHYLLVTIWNQSLLWLIILLLLVMATMYAIFYWRTQDEMDVAKILRGFWRVSFLLFLTIYVFLIVYGLIQSIIS